MIPTPRKQQLGRMREVVILFFLNFNHKPNLSDFTQVECPVRCKNLFSIKDRPKHRRVQTTNQDTVTGTVLRDDSVKVLGSNIYSGQAHLEVGEYCK